MPSPLIVCGFPRSGTRTCANILANSLDVELQGEIPPGLAGPTFEWLRVVQSEWGKGGEERLYGLMRETFRRMAKSKPIARSNARWFGHKTPRHEKYFDDYEALFGLQSRRPHYVYCLRNPFDVWRSYRSMPWARIPDVDAFLTEWKSSVEAFEAMRDEAKDRVHLFDLDEMIGTTDTLAWLEGRIFGPLAISTSTFRVPVETLKNSNSSEAKFGSRPEELPERDVAAIAADRRVQRMISAYFPALRERVAQDDSSWRRLITWR